MARDERKSVKVRDLEGLIRHYKKQLELANREISRLKKHLERFDAEVIMGNKKNTDDNGFPVQEPKKEKKLKCEKCKEGTLGNLKLADAGGKEKTFLVCNNSRCGNRKVVKNVQEG